MTNTTTLDIPLATSLAITGFLGEFSFALTTFGTAIIFQIAWQISFLLSVGSGNISGALINLSINEVIMATVQTSYLWYKRTLISWPFVFNALIWICSGVVLGVWSLKRLDHNIWLKRALGFFLFFVALLRVFIQKFKKSKSINANKKKDELDLELHNNIPNLSLLSTQLAIASSFVSSGFLGGLYGVAGPPQMLFVLYYSHSLNRELWRATNASMRFIYSIVRLLYLIHLGDITFTTQSHWLEFGCMIVSGMVGLSIGNVLSRYVNDSMFQNLILLFLMCGSLLMSTSGWSEIQHVAIIVIVSSIGVGIGVGCMKWMWNRCTMHTCSSREDDKKEKDELTEVLLEEE